MIGIIFIAALVIWVLIALGLSKLLWVMFRFFVDRSQKGNGKETSSGNTLRNATLQLMLVAVIFFLPITDEIVAYPKYSEMCQETGKYHFAHGMDAKLAYGRHYYSELGESRYTRIFPKLQTLKANDNKESGIVVEIRELRVIDGNTRELLMTSNGIRPISSMSAISWDGARYPWLLHKCDWNVGKNAEDSKKLIRSLKLKRIVY